MMFSLTTRGGDGTRAEGAEMIGGETERGAGLLLLGLDQPNISPNPFLVLGFFSNFPFSLSARGGEALLTKKEGIAAVLRDRLNEEGGAVSSMWIVNFSFSFVLFAFSPKNDEGIFLSDFRIPPVPLKLEGVG
jgi:hypothetical protein